MKTAAIDPRARILSLDQFRGYTVVGMFLVNFIGGYQVVHDVLKHHNTYNSYADTIMPHFFFAVGFATRLGMLKGAETGAMVKRGLGLVLLGLVVYGLDGNYKTWASLTELGWWGFIEKSFLRSPFQALTHIGVTCLWILPVMRRRSRDLILFGMASGLLHLALSGWFWFEFLMRVRVIDGGMLGFLSWAVPTLAGALAYDAVKKYGAAMALPVLLRWGVVLSLVGYLISCVHGVEAPPFWPPWNPVDLWTMTQRAGSLSYQTFSAGFSLLVYGGFLWLADIRKPGFESAFLRTFGTNALAGYLIHSMVSDVVRKFAPKDSTLLWVCFVTGVYFLITWSFVRALEKRGLFLRL
ncbi:MAG: heparan-alpha-glucosaminide N-acetyltransferase domain-containing protein [Acidobacteria bacterium]|nr:heparan-alpha-glucosaminide N-acetyltransferase domain-containing protein [Acidobacteriota bacterium]